MLKGINIRLEGPICDCAEGDLGWGIRRDDKGKSTLLIFCNECDTQLLVPHKKFRAYISLDIPYPGKAAEPKPKPGSGLKFKDGGRKVIPLFPTNEIRK